MVSVSLRAGDLAPDIAFTEVLSAAVPRLSGSWDSAKLTGQLTVVVFFPVTSLNPSSVRAWNALVEQFADQPLQFVWITAEYRPPLGPWLREHPLNGWVFLDPLGATAQSYGIEEPVAVLIGPDRRILGFDRTMLPSVQTVSAALEGPTAGSAGVRLDPQPPRLLGAESLRFRPDFPKSQKVHISRSEGVDGTTLSTGGDHWSALGFTLKELLANAYGVPESCIDLAPKLDTSVRHDVAFVPPGASSQAAIGGRIQRAVAQHFWLDVRRQTRPMEIYVLSAPGGRAALAPYDAQVGVALTAADFHSGVSLPQVQHFAAIGRGAVFAHLGLLPFSLGLLVVDDTERDGYYFIDVQCIGRSREEGLSRALWKDLGIAATRERRDLELLVVRRRSGVADSE